MNMETERLVLRELKEADTEYLHAILSDPESMQYYPAPFSLEQTRKWIQWNLENYQKYGFGLWAVILKESNLFIGDCGITMQNINGSIKPEIGYHIKKEYACRGYATEAAGACMEYAFADLGIERLYSYMKYTNVPSQRVAQKNGMKCILQYEDVVNTFTRVYAISKEEHVG